MRRIAGIAVVGCFLALVTGCSSGQPSTFTFIADLPPDFAYVAAVYYVPAEGETCTVETKDNLAPVFNYEWRKEYKPDAEIEIRITRKGCPLVVRRVKLEINSAYGKDRGDLGRESALVVIRHELKEQSKGTFSGTGESTFYGQFQWLFRTSGKPRILRKVLDCKAADAQGTLDRGHLFSGYG